MLVLDLIHPVFEQLLRRHLQNCGLLTINPIPTTNDDPFRVVLTDKESLPTTDNRSVVYICLLNKHTALPQPFSIQVKGVLSGDCELDELETCIQRVLARQSYVSSGLLNVLVPTNELTDPRQGKPLTRRETEVLALIRQGISTQQIADKLDISLHTAENHRANIQKKKGLKGPLSLIKYAIGG